MSDDAPNPNGGAARDVWPEPAPSEVDAVTQVPLDKDGDLNPWAAPGDPERSGPGHTVVSAEPIQPVRPVPPVGPVRPVGPVQQGEPIQPVPDQSALIQPVPDQSALIQPVPDHQSAPKPPVPQGQVPPPVHHQPTVTSLPPVDGTPASWASPDAAFGSAPPPNPFAAPPVHHNGVIPPPPIAPDGPGQVPYGYPGGYGYPAHPQAPYGWAGAPRPESNGMGITSMVLGIVSAVGFCLWPLAIVLGILAIVFGVVGRKKAGRGEATNPGQALAGIICGAAGLALGLGLISLIAFLPS